MSYEGEDSTEQEPESRTDRDEDAPTDARNEYESSRNPFSTPKLGVELRQFVGSKIAQALPSPFDEQDEPETPSEPPADDSPFSTPEVEEITRGAPPTPDDGD